MHRLQPVAHIGQRARDDGGEGVGEIAVSPARRRNRTSRMSPATAVLLMQEPRMQVGARYSSKLPQHTSTKRVRAGGRPRPCGAKTRRSRKNPVRRSASSTSPRSGAAGRLGAEERAATAVAARDRARPPRPRRHGRNWARHRRARDVAPVTAQRARSRPKSELGEERQLPNDVGGRPAAIGVERRRGATPAPRRSADAARARAAPHSASAAAAARQASRAGDRR